MLDTLKQYSVINLPIHLIPDYKTWLWQRLEAGIGIHVVTLNAEMAIFAQENPELAQTIQQADLVIPDGAGVVIFLRFRGYRQQRQPGIELAESLLQEISKQLKNYPICFYGGAPGVAEAAARVWQQKASGLEIISNHGYLSSAEEAEWKQTLAKTQPKLILIALGVPRQEFWIRDNRSLCPDAIWIGVGGSFDIWAGTKTRAPVWLRENNLEWLYRLYREPWRWRRMLALPKFFWLSLLSKS
jgi:N-acetylglucosaminyldiphosphoundecaprenol N-acetyl-beta-D-mannosaminyltransferase